MAEQSHFNAVPIIALVGVLTLVMVLALVVWLLRHDKSTAAKLLAGLGVVGLVAAALFSKTGREEVAAVQDNRTAIDDKPTSGTTDTINLDGTAKRPTTPVDSPAAESEEPGLPDLNTPITDITTTEPTDDPSRPAWIDEPIESSDGIHRVKIETIPFEDPNRCQIDVKSHITSEAQSYSEREFGYREIAIDEGFLEAKIQASKAAGNYYLEKTKYHYGTLNPETKIMYTAHLLLEFSKDDHLEFEKLSNQAMAKYRVYYASAGLAAFLVLLTTVFGYLRADQVTAGQARGRLQLAAGGVIVALIGAGVLFANFVPLI
jgi:hypothetical protein